MENLGKPKVVIIGAGFGGLKAAQGLRKAAVDLLVIDKTNHHLFQPLLYQVATAALSENNIATPIRDILHRQDNATIIMNEVTAIDKQNNTLTLMEGEKIPFDSLIIAAGAINTYFGNNAWKIWAHGLKSLTDALKIREHILLSFELSEECSDPKQALKYLRFVVIGGGPTGVEMAGAIAEIVRTSLLKYFKKFDPKMTEVFLVESYPEILTTYPPKLSAKAQTALEKLGVTVLTNTRVTNITSAGVYTKDRFIESANIIWAAGNSASPLLQSLDVPLDKQGRVIVEPDLSLPHHPHIFVIGDAAAAADSRYGTLPGVAQVAIQEGEYVANLIKKQIPKEKRKPFKYFDKGSMATIGKAKAVAVIGKFCFSGLFAWLLWGLIHVMFLISFRNRFIVMIEWMFLYFTDTRNASIITKSIDEIKSEEEGGST
jgi:NADH dehydrogenase